MRLKLILLLFIVLAISYANGGDKKTSSKRKNTVQQNEGATSIKQGKQNELPKQTQQVGIARRGKQKKKAKHNKKKRNEDVKKQAAQPNSKGQLGLMGAKQTQQSKRVKSAKKSQNRAAQAARNAEKGRKVIARIRAKQAAYVGANSWENEWSKLAWDPVKRATRKANPAESNVAQVDWIHELFE